MNTLSGIRILLVEDEFLVADLAEDLLREMGVEVVGPAYSLTGGLELAASEAIDAAVLDVNLNGERSFPIADLLEGRGIPHLFVTGYGRAGIEGRTGPVLDKPYEARKLQQALRDMLHQES